jgi:hypothetical protein
MLAKYGIDVVGFQEFQGPQHRAFLAQAGRTYAVWAPPGDAENSIAWRRMPVIRLLDLRTG